jgi:hypothetical protein
VSLPWKTSDVNLLDDVMNAFSQPNDLIIEAKAGTGKTSTLKKLANMVPDSSILYLVYNTKN